MSRSAADEVLLNQGTIYASLVRLEQRGWIAAEWGTSDNNRKAKFYSITAAGRKQLAKDAAYWQRLSDVMGRVLTMAAEERRLCMSAPAASFAPRCAPSSASRQLDADLEAEIAAHLEMAIEENLRRGLLPWKPAARRWSALAAWIRRKTNIAKREDL